MLTVLKSYYMANQRHIKDYVWITLLFILTLALLYGFLMKAKVLIH